MSTIVTRSGKGSPLTNTEVDANFTNLNTDKLELSGGTLTGNLSLGDNVQLQLGNQTNGDLQIYHDGLNSYIRDTGTGNLNISADQLRVLNAGNNEIKAQFTTDGAVDLYHNNQLKLSTTATGIDVTGNVVADGLTVSSATSSNSTFINGVGTGMQITLADQGWSAGINQNAGSLYLQSGGLTNRLKLASNGDISFYNDSAAQAFFFDSSTSRLGLGTTVPSAPLSVMANTSASVPAAGADSSHLAVGKNDQYGTMIGSLGSGDGYIQQQRFDGNTATYNLLVQPNGGRVGINNSNPATALDVTGTVTADGLTVLDGLAVFRNLDDSPVQFISGTVGDKEALTFERNGGAVKGSIEYQQSPIGFNIGTDTGHAFRLKTGGTQRLNIANNGDISFYEDTGTTPKFFWDASAESLGIGTSSPSQDIEILNGTTGSGIRLAATATAYWDIERDPTSGHLTFTDDGAGTVLTLGQDGSSVFSGSLTSTGLTVTKASTNADVTYAKMRMDSWGFSTGKLKSIEWNDVGNAVAAIGAEYDGSKTNIHFHSQYNGAFKGTSDKTMSIMGNGNVNIPNGGLMVGATTAPKSLINLIGTGSDGGILTLENNSTSLVTGRHVGQIDFYSNDGSSNGAGVKAKITAVAENSIGSEIGLTFGTSGTGSSTAVEAMRIDSSGNVGIGTNSVGGRLEIKKATASNETIFAIEASGVTTTTVGSITYDQSDDSMRLLNNSQFGGTSLRFGTRGSDDVIIDYSGNLLVGKTYTATGNVGQELRAGGYTAFTRSGGNPLELKRLASDGSLINFYKDGTAVGSIGTEGGDLCIGSSVSGHKGVRFGSSYIAPINTSSAFEDATTDLGLPAVRFKDLRLSGGVYLGGTGAANKLDDVETGSWNPSFGGTGVNPTVSFSTTGPAEYVKVGKVVTASMAFFGNITAAGSGTASVQGLPFQAKGSRGVASINYNSATANSTTGVSGYIEDNTTICYLHQGGSTTGETWTAGTNQRLFFTITYIVD